MPIRSVRIIAGAICLVAGLLVGGAERAAAADGADGETFFETRIRPVLITSCAKCHGAEKASAALRLDSREALLKGGDNGAAIVPGDPAASRLIEAIGYKNADLQMPPNKPLAVGVVADFTTWVKQGAPWPEPKPGRTGDAFQAARHWAFVPVRAQEPPADASGWGLTPIDRFVNAKLQGAGLAPVESADRRTLFRRAYFDLLGLPPASEEVAAFVADEAPDAFAQTIDRLLDSPRYGERWGRHWMDVARYADTAGDNADYPIPEARLYRDYVIDAFNRDMPFDQFIREQVAGDLLAPQGPPERYAEQVAATGYIALSRRYATAPFELMHLTLEDTVDTLGRSFLGLTLRCARCHDHKFDPVTAEDYYALYGIFASTRYPFAGSEEFQSKSIDRFNFVPLVPPSEAAPLLEEHREQIDSLQESLHYAEEAAARDAASCDARGRELKRLIALLEDAGEEPRDFQRELDAVGRERGEAKKRHDAEIKELKAELRLLQRPGLPAGLPGAYAVSDGPPVHSPIHQRGEPADPGPVVHRGVPKFLAGDAPPVFPEDSSGRLQLAEWLASPANPLTARVIVNRVWQHHFGRGIVATPSNFGLRGDEPTHPELLDYLASTFVARGWSIKALHREIMLSKTYQLASSSDPRLAELDPANKLFGRSERRRLDAEAIRDAILVVSGDLDLRRPEAHPFPQISKWNWTQHQPFKEVYPTAHRSVYLMTQRLQRHPYLALFDGPDTNTTTDQRTSSIVPLQALFMLNNPWMRSEAEAFAKRLIAAASAAGPRIRLAHELAYGRAPLPEEMERGEQYLGDYTAELARTGMETEQIELEAWLSYARVLLTANEFVYLD